MFADKACRHRIYEDICPLCEEARAKTRDNLRRKIRCIKNILSDYGIGSTLKIEKIKNVVEGK